MWGPPQPAINPTLAHLLLEAPQAACPAHRVLRPLRLQLRHAPHVHAHAVAPAQLRAPGRSVHAVCHAAGRREQPAACGVQGRGHSGTELAGPRQPPAPTAAHPHDPQPASPPDSVQPVSHITPPCSAPLSNSCVCGCSRGRVDRWAGRAGWCSAERRRTEAGSEHSRSSVPAAAHLWQRWPSGHLAQLRAGAGAQATAALQAQPLHPCAAQRHKPPVQRQRRRQAFQRCAAGRRWVLQQAALHRSRHMRGPCGLAGLPATTAAASAAASCCARLRLVIRPQGRLQRSLQRPGMRCRELRGRFQVGGMLRAVQRGLPVQPAGLHSKARLLLPQTGSLLSSQAGCTQKHAVQRVRPPARLQQLRQRLCQLLLQRRYLATGRVACAARCPRRGGCASTGVQAEAAQASADGSAGVQQRAAAWPGTAWRLPAPPGGWILPAAGGAGAGHLLRNSCAGLSPLVLSLQSKGSTDCGIKSTSCDTRSSSCPCALPCSAA